MSVKEYLKKILKIFPQYPYIVKIYKILFNKNASNSFLSPNFKRYEDLNKDIKNNLYKIPHDIDLIVGIPRSGMLAAYMIGFLKNLQVISITEFVNGLFEKIGERPLNNIGKNILVVDDSCCYGNAIKKCKNLLSPYSNDFNIKYLVVYSNPETESIADISLLNCSLPRMFQWNYLNHVNIENSCFDLDGVLCNDPTAEENDDGENYIKFLKNAVPMFIPKYKIHAIVTCRLEKYRSYTEKWLQENNVKYDKLYMLDLPDAITRRKKNIHAKFKANIYKKLKNTNFFYESDYNQAKEIFELTGKPVLCVKEDIMFSK